jgi:CheY-like chemotaxis protein
MVPLVFVKVVGFTDVERHALNTVFRLSRDREVAYTLWTPDAPMAPHLGLIDCESYEGKLELTSPGHNANLKLICVGAGAPDRAWKVFARPLLWPTVVQAMDRLFVPPEPVDIDVDFAADEMDDLDALPPGVKVSLLVDAARDQRMYLRARLALAGLLEVEEANTGAQALDLARKRHFDLVIVSLDMPDMDGWKLVERLIALEPVIGRVVLSTADKSWHMQESAERVGCFAVLERPFDPGQVIRLLQKV